MMMAGGDYQTGRTIGASDRSYSPTENPVGPLDLQATLFDHFGIEKGIQRVDNGGRPRYLLEGEAKGNIIMDEHTIICIVGKSSSLSGKKLGSVIESHDLITRINFKDGDHDESLYLEDLGEKTHHIVAHPKVLRYYIKYAVDDLVKSLESIEDSEYQKSFHYYIQ